MGQAVTSTIGGLSSLYAGKAEKKARYAEAAAYEQEARYIDLQTKQAANNARGRLDSALGAIAAVKAARNLALDSPTSRATDKAVTDEYGAAIEADQLTGMLNARSRRDAARSAIVAGKAAKMGSYFRAGASFVDAAASLMPAPGKGK